MSLLKRAIQRLGVRLTGVRSAGDYVDVCALSLDRLRAQLGARVLIDFRGASPIAWQLKRFDIAQPAARHHDAYLNVAIDRGDVRPGEVPSAPFFTGVGDGVDVGAVEDVGVGEAETGWPAEAEGGGLAAATPAA